MYFNPTDWKKNIQELTAMETPYRPIDCSYYDRLEAWATLKGSCAIVWMDQDKVKHEVQSRIMDLVIQNHVEYLVVEKGLRIRLDHLISINDIPLDEDI